MSLIADQMPILPLGVTRDQDGMLNIDGFSVSKLAGEWGTPLYLYHAGTFYDQVHIIRKLIERYYPAEHEISYAGKAYLSLPFARKILQCGLTLDTVSLGEMTIAKMAGFPPAKVHLHGNNKSEEELRFAVDWGVENIVLDSLEEIEFLESIAAETGRQVDIWLRITPGVEVETHPYVQTAHTASKFGFPIEDEQAQEGIRRVSKSKWVHLQGLHMHIGSQIFDIDPYLRALRSIIQLAEAEKIQLNQISPGGGWGVPYVPGQRDIDLETLIKEISALIVSESQRLGWAIPKLVVEPGRKLIARAGLAVYQVGTSKHSSDGTRFIAIDGGMADNPRPALYQSRYIALPVSRPHGEYHPCTLVGKFCETGDRLIEGVMLPDLERGDLLAVPVSGAYQLSMASNYNLAGRPAVLWLEEGRAEMMQPREQISQMDWWTG